MIIVADKKNVCMYIKKNKHEHSEIKHAFVYGAHSVFNEERYHIYIYI